MKILLRFLPLLSYVTCAHASAVVRRQPNALWPLTEYVFVSQPGHQAIAVAEVNAVTRKVTREARPIITAGLTDPCGLAVDHDRQRLYVADPKAKKVFMYNLHFNDHGIQVDQEQFVAASGLTPRWVTVDEKGTLFATDEQRSFIAEVDADTLDIISKGGTAHRHGVTSHEFTKLYSHTLERQVDRPGGVATNGNQLFWGNRVRGTPYGSLLSAPEDPSQLEDGIPRMIHSLSKNVDKVYGVCASKSLVFYTGGEKSVYGAKTTAFQQRAAETVVLNDYAIPRGCVWDGDGTVLIADKGGEAIWSFPSSLHGLGLTQATKMFDVEDPYGVAVFRPSLTLNSVGFLRGVSWPVGPSALLLSVLSVLGLCA